MTKKATRKAARRAAVMAAEHLANVKAAAEKKEKK